MTPLRAAHLGEPGFLEFVHALECLRGDHGLYLLFREADRWRRTCPPRRRCGHAEAVSKVTE